MRFLNGLLLGALGTTAGIAYVLATTTISYRSRLFEGDLVRVLRIRGNLDAPARPVRSRVTP